MVHRRLDSELPARWLCLKVGWRTEGWRMCGDAVWLMHTYRTRRSAGTDRKSRSLSSARRKSRRWDLLYLSHLHWLQLQPKNVEVFVSRVMTLRAGRRDTLVWSTSAPTTVRCHVHQIWCDSWPGQSKTCFPNLWEDVEEPVIHCVKPNLSLHAEAVSSPWGAWDPGYCEVLLMS